MSVVGPDTYAQQFSEADARIELTNWQQEQKDLPPSSEAYKNIQKFVDALKSRLEKLTKKEETDHPTEEWKPPPPSIGRTLISELTGPVVDPIMRLTDNTETSIKHWTGNDIPLPPGAEHRDPSEGPDPMGALWNAITQTSPHPLAVIEAIWKVTVTTFDYIVWDVEEFVRLIRAWNGSVYMFVGHPQYLFDVVWRSLVTGLLVAGAVMSGPLLMAMAEWTRMMVEVLLTLGNWLASAVSGVSRSLRGSGR